MKNSLNQILAAQSFTKIFRKNVTHLMTEIKYECAPTYTEVGYVTLFAEYVGNLQAEINFELEKYLCHWYIEVS